MLEPKRLKRSPILEYSIANLLEWFKLEFAKYAGSSVKLSVAQIGNLANLRQLSESVRKNDGTDEAKLQYPYMGVVIGDISLNTDEGALNKHWGRNKAFTINKDVDAGKALNLYIRPVKVGISFVFSTDNLNQLIDFSHVLLMNAPKIGFRMELGKFSIGIIAEIEPSTQIPESNLESPGVAYQFQALVILNTYIGHEGEVGLIKSMSFKVVESNDPAAESTVVYDGEPSVLLDRTIHFTDYFNKENTPYGDQ